MSLEDLVKSLDSIKNSVQDYAMSVEIFEDGYRSEIHVYNRVH